MAELFDTFAPYRRLVDSGHYVQSIEEGLAMLQAIKGFSKGKFDQAHKGTPYYIMGYCAFASHDYTGASLLFDAAASEDLKNHNGRPNTPALKFMKLEPDGKNQLAQQIVASIDGQVRALIKEYNSRSGAKAITRAEFKKHFLDHLIYTGSLEQRALITAFFSFVAEWGYRIALIDVVPVGSREPFFMHIFRGCVLFESLLKNQEKKTLTKYSLGDILKDDLMSELSLTSVDLTPSTGFNGIILSLSPAMNINSTINSVGRTRNTMAHNVVWTNTALNAKTYNLLVKNIASACLHAISKLYC